MGKIGRWFKMDSTSQINVDRACSVKHFSLIIIFFSILTHFIIAYHISLVIVETNYCINNLLILNVKQLNEITKPYYFYNIKSLRDGQGKINMYYGISRVNKLLSGKRSITFRQHFTYLTNDSHTA